MSTSISMTGVPSSTSFISLQSVISTEISASPAATSTNTASIPSPGGHQKLSKSKHAVVIGTCSAIAGLILILFLVAVPYRRYHNRQAALHRALTRSDPFSTLTQHMPLHTWRQILIRPQGKRNLVSDVEQHSNMVPADICQTRFKQRPALPASGLIYASQPGPSDDPERPETQRDIMMGDGAARHGFINQLPLSPHNTAQASPPHYEP
ncbi:hypothetical protein CVT24_006905 [Panaeolus cyanescens]|uniref:Uncharacterized protein n=1 Tax=Panaeolus cyanescens TaxID=181874 RepID=A0A409X8W4_9AGAR|nr:hypothetical protein CVT24_006905 [Panaeolus cyanescens]